MNILDNLLYRFGYIRKSEFDEKLDSDGSIEKRLDEHRKMVEELDLESSFFQDKPGVVEHLACQDDHLMHLYHVVRGAWPPSIGESAEDEHTPLRSRPAILGQCRLPEYALEQYTKTLFHIGISPSWMKYQRLHW